MKSTIWVPSQEFLYDQKKWIQEEVDQLSEKIPDLVQVAVESLNLADPPYSKYPVGAAVLCLSGNIYAGANSEPCVYTTTVHAEGGSIYNAILNGEKEKSKTRFFVRAVAISTISPGSNFSGPCGICRQTIREYAHKGNALIIVSNERFEILAQTSLQALLPLSFGPEHII